MAVPFVEKEVVRSVVSVFHPFVPKFPFGIEAWKRPAIIRGTVIRAIPA
jgi:hypothetical protein